MKKKRMMSLLSAAAVFWCLAAPGPILAESVDSASESGAAALAVSDPVFTVDGTALTKYHGTASFVTVPDGVRVIRGGAFAGNKNVATVYLPDSVAEIEGGAFENCSNLESIITSGMSKLTTIGANAFAGCSRLNTSFAFGVGSVSDSAFGQKSAEAVAAFKTAQPTAATTADPAQAAGTAPAANPVPDSGAETYDDFKIIQQPVSVRAAEGDFVSFSVFAIGGDDIRYQWMRRSKDGGEWTNIETNSTAFQDADTFTLSFTVTTARANQEFRCAVMDGERVLLSNVVSVLAPGSDAAETAEQAFSAPNTIGAWQESGDSVMIVWNPLEVASGYELYRSENGGEFALIKTVDGCSYTDTGLALYSNDYSYAIAAVIAGDMGRSELSAPIHVQRLSASQDGIELNGVGYAISNDGAVVIAFQGRGSSLVIPASIQKGNLTYPVIGIGPNVFRNNVTLKSITLPNTIKYIETGAFAYCNAMIDH